MLRWLTLLALIFSFVRTTTAQDSSCSADLLTGLTVGAEAEMPPGPANNVRGVPSRSGDRVTQLEGGDIVSVIDGPECSEGFVWWQIETSAGLSGWTPEGQLADDTTFAEYYLFRRDVLDFADDFSVNLEFDGVSRDANLRLWVASIKRIDTLFSPYTTIDLVDYLYAYPEAEAVIDEAWPYPLSVLWIEPVGYYDPYVPAYWAEAQELHDFLTEQPENPEFVPAPAKTFDDNLTQLFVAQPAYLDFQNGSGVRFLTSYSFFPEDENPIPYISYDFQGLTNDGRYYINGNFRLFSDALDLDFDGGDYDAYLADVREQVSQLSQDDFQPTLTELDTMIKSLLVEGSDETTSLALEDEQPN